MVVELGPSGFMGLVEEVLGGGVTMGAWLPRWVGLDE